MTLEQAIKRCTDNAEYERTHENLQGYLEFRQLAEWLKDYKRLLKQESCEDWHDVPSDEMNLEQAKQAVRDLRKFIVDNHISPKLQYCEDAISRQAVEKITCEEPSYTDALNALTEVREKVRALPPVIPQPKTGYWITKIKSDLRGDMWPTNPKCSECGGEPYYNHTIYNYKFCPYCGVKMQEVTE